MKSKYPLFDRGRLLVKPLAERAHDLQIEHWLSLEDSAPECAFAHPQLGEVAQRIVAAGRSGAARILMMGAHVLRAGVNRHIRAWRSCDSQETFARIVSQGICGRSRGLQAPRPPLHPAGKQKRNR